MTTVRAHCCRQPHDAVGGTGCVCAQEDMVMLLRTVSSALFRVGLLTKRGACVLCLPAAASTHVAVAASYGVGYPW